MNGDRYKLHKNILSQAFHRDSLKEYHDVMVKHTSEFVSMLSKEERYPFRTDIYEKFTNVTFDIIGEVAMGVNFNTQYHEHPYSKAFVEYVTHSFYTIADCFISGLEEAGKRDLNPFRRFYHVTANLALERNLKILHDVPYQILLQHRQSPSENDNSILAFMIKADPESGDAMTDDEIVKEVNTLMYSPLVL
jgi:cytochrome P450